MKSAAVAASLLIGLLLTAVVPPASGRGDEPDVTLYVPAFQADGPLGIRAATVVNLQLSQTLRQAPILNPDGVSFGRGTIVWDPAAFRGTDHAAAERAASDRGADAVLWGRAWRYGGGVVVQTYLTLVPGLDERVAWKTSVDAGGERLSLAVRLPRRRYEFSPIVLRPDVVEGLGSAAGLRLVAARESNQVVGEIGETYRALRHEDSWTLVRSGEVEGWLQLPPLSERHSEVIDFVGGLVRLLRTDWSGASALLRRVADNPSAPGALRVDATLLLGLAAGQEGRDPLPELRRAHDLNPHDVDVTKYECMAHVVRLARARSANGRAEARVRLQEILDARSYQYAAQDPWFRKVRAIVED